MVFLKSRQKNIAKGDLEMLKCAAVHPRVSSPCRSRPLAALPSLHQPGCWGFPVLWWQPFGTEQSPLELVAWVVLLLSAALVMAKPLLAALRFLLSIGPPEPLLLISEEKRLLMEHLQLPGDSAAHVWKKTLYWAVSQTLLGEMLLLQVLWKGKIVLALKCVVTENRSARTHTRSKWVVFDWDTSLLNCIFFGYGVGCNQPCTITLSKKVLW